jgi:hypothetical protein
MADILKNNKGYSSDVNLPRNRRKSRKNNLKKQLENFKESIKYLPANPDWYKINEIDIRDFVYCTQRLFKLVDNDIKEDGNYDDIFMKEIFIAQQNSSESQWLEFDKVRRTQQALSQRLGDFHEELAGKFPGYRTVHTGHWSGLNVMREDRKIYMEWKNRGNISTDVKEKVFEKFQYLLDKKTEPLVQYVVLVCVNVPDKWKKPDLVIKNKSGKVKIDLTKYKDKIHIMSGREAYTALSGSSTFFDRLLETIKFVFKNKSAYEFIMSIKTSMNMNL